MSANTNAPTGANCRKPSARWRKVRTGSMLGPPIEYHLVRGVVVLVRVAQMPSGKWYFYGNGHNSLNRGTGHATSWRSPDDAKREAKAQLERQDRKVDP